MGLRERKQIDYASNNVGSSTPAWLKMPKPSSCGPATAAPARRSLTDDFKGLEKDCKRGKGDDAIPASLADRLANRKPLGDVDTNAGGLPGPGQHHDKGAIGVKHKKGGLAARPPLQLPEQQQQQQQQKEGLLRRKSTAVDGNGSKSNHSKEGKRRGRPKSAPLSAPEVMVIDSEEDKGEEEKEGCVAKQAKKGTHKEEPKIAKGGSSKAKHVQGQEHTFLHDQPPAAGGEAAAHAPPKQHRSTSPPEGGDAPTEGPRASKGTSKRKGKSAPLSQLPEAGAAVAELAEGGGAQAKGSKRKSAGAAMVTTAAAAPVDAAAAAAAGGDGGNAGASVAPGNSAGGGKAGARAVPGAASAEQEEHGDSNKRRKQERGGGGAGGSAGGSGSSGGFKTLEEIAREQQQQQQQQQQQINARARASLGHSKGAEGNVGAAQVVGNVRGHSAPAGAAAPGSEVAVMAVPSAEDVKEGQAPKAKGSDGGSDRAAAAAAAAAVPGSSDAREASLLRPLSPTTINANASFRAFNTLQRQYVQLQELYQQLKAQKITELEGLLEEQDEYVEAVNTSVNALAQHWKEEAEHQMQLTKTAGAQETLDHLKSLEEENLAMKRTIVDHEVAAVQLHIQLAEVRQQVAAATSRAERAAAVERELQLEMQQLQQLQEVSSPQQLQQRSAQQQKGTRPQKASLQLEGAERMPPQQQQGRGDVMQQQSECREGVQSLTGWPQEGLVGDLGEKRRGSGLGQESGLAVGALMMMQEAGAAASDGRVGGRVPAGSGNICTIDKNSYKDGHSNRGNDVGAGTEEDGGDGGGGGFVEGEDGEAGEGGVGGGDARMEAVVGGPVGSKRGQGREGGGGGPSRVVAARAGAAAGAGGGGRVKRMEPAVEGRKVAGGGRGAPTGATSGVQTEVEAGAQVGVQTEIETGARGGVQTEAASRGGAGSTGTASKNPTPPPTALLPTPADTHAAAGAAAPGPVLHHRTPTHTATAAGAATPTPPVVGSQPTPPHSAHPHQQPGQLQKHTPSHVTHPHQQPQQQPGQLQEHTPSHVTHPHQQPQQQQQQEQEQEHTPSHVTRPHQESQQQGHSVAMQFPTPTAPPPPSPGIACQFPTPHPSSSSVPPSHTHTQDAGPTGQVWPSSSSVVAHMPTPQADAADTMLSSYSVDQEQQQLDPTHLNSDKTPRTNTRAPPPEGQRRRSSGAGSPVDGLCTAEGDAVGKATSVKKGDKSRASGAHIAEAKQQQEHTPRALIPEGGDSLIAHAAHAHSPPPQPQPQPHSPHTEGVRVPANPDVIDLNPMSARKAARQSAVVRVAQGGGAVSPVARMEPGVGSPSAAEAAGLRGGIPGGVCGADGGGNGGMTTPAHCTAQAHFASGEQHGLPAAMYTPAAAAAGAAVGQDGGSVWGSAGGWQPMTNVRLARLEDDMVMEDGTMEPTQHEHQVEHRMPETMPWNDGIGNGLPSDNNERSGNVLCVSPNAFTKRGPLPTAATCPPPAPVPGSTNGPCPTTHGNLGAGGRGWSAGFGGDGGGRRADLFEAATDGDLASPVGGAVQSPPHAQQQQQQQQQLSPAHRLCPGLEQIRAAAVAGAAALAARTDSVLSVNSNAPAPLPASAAAPPVVDGQAHAPWGLQVDVQQQQQQQQQQQFFSPQTSSVVSPRVQPDGASVAGSQQRLQQGLAGEAAQNGSGDGDNFGGYAPAAAPAMTPSMTPKMARMQAGVSGLLGFRVMPLPQEGAYEYSHLATGMRFQLCPTTEDSSPDSELLGYLPGTNNEAHSLHMLDFFPLCLGRAPAKLPSFMHAHFQFEEGGKQAFMNHLWEALTH